MDTVGVALVGCGFALRTQLPAFLRTGAAQVRCLVGRDAERTQQLAERHGIPVWSTDLDAALADPAVDLVCVSTPPDLHRDQSERALLAGKHVLCEKPMAMDAGEAASMCRTASASGRLALLDHQLRFSPGLARLRRLVHDGYAGAPLHVQVSVLSDAWLDRTRDHGWWSEAGRGGGVLGALGSHVIDALIWMFGDVESAGCTAHTFVRERRAAGELRARPVTSEDYALAALRFTAGGVQAQMLLSVVAHRAGGLRIEVHGDEGVLVHDPEGRLWGSRRDPGRRGEPSPLDLLVEPDDAERLWSDTLWDRAFAAYAAALVASIRGGAPAPEDAARFEDGLSVQRVLDAARRAAASGRVEAIAATP